MIAGICLSGICWVSMMAFIKGFTMGDELLIAALAYVVACLGLILYLQRRTSKLKTKVDALTVLIKESDRQREAVKRELQELRSGTIGVGRRVLEIEKKLGKQSEMLEEASYNDPQAKLYARAVKMVSLGAGIEELMSECELPKAEAELLLRLHKR
jgi:cell division protein FtsL